MAETDLKPGESLVYFRRPKGLPDDSHVVNNTYECSCGNTWEDSWDSGCDDECAACGETIEPSQSEPDPDCDCEDCLDVKWRAKREAELEQYQGLPAVVFDLVKAAIVAADCLAEHAELHSDDEDAVGELRSALETLKQSELWKRPVEEKAVETAILDACADGTLVEPYVFVPVMEHGDVMPDPAIETVRRAMRGGGN